MKRFLTVIAILVMGLTVLPVSALDDAQKTAISDNCALIKESLKNTQRADARARVFFGGKFETILSKFITPLNVKLVEKNITNLGLIENQSNFAAAKTTFSDNFIKYQQVLEELVGINCENEPDNFYKKLVEVRGYRKKVEQDITKVKKVILENIKLVTELKGNL